MEPDSEMGGCLAGGTFYSQDQGDPWFDRGRNAAGRSRNDDSPFFPTATWLNGIEGGGRGHALILTP
jgi:hypothetical protein